MAEKGGVRFLNNIRLIRRGISKVLFLRRQPGLRREMILKSTETLRHQKYVSINSHHFHFTIHHYLPTYVKKSEAFFRDLFTD